MELKICHLYPEALNLYGDRGNILCLQRRCAWRGIDCTVTPLPAGETARFADFDLFFLGGGQDFEQEVLLRDLAGGKARELREAAADGKAILAVCGGYQMLGSYYRTWDGHQLDYTGAVDLYTVGAKERIIGNFVFRCPPESGGGTVVGFENHSGRTYLGEGVAPLGTVVHGCGNNGCDGTEGVRWRNVFGTYSHGPVLPKNPGLCDALLLAALRRRYGEGVSLAPLPDAEERRAHDAAEAEIENFAKNPRRKGTKI